MLPKSQAELGEKETIKAMILIDALEELEDVQQVSSNLNVTDEMMAKYELVG
jgi:transcriptional/translational regulatory protein YebC/TACO1